MIPIADLQEQLQAVLSDPNAMGQITAIARALTGGSQNDTPPSEPTSATEATDVEFVPVESSDTETATSASSAPDLTTLLSAFGNSSPNIDPKFISFALELLSEYSAENDEKIALLLALKPFLKAERLEKLEKAEKISRLTRIVHTALRHLKEEGGNV